jgi:uncharacterized protein (DUF305 family)
MPPLRTALTLALFLVFVPALTGAQQDHSRHGGGVVDRTADGNAVTRAFQEVNARMHREMAVSLTGDADRDFAAAMIPHHQGAIDMARIVLEHGSDPEIRKVAQEVIQAQEAEIAQLREWLARHGG